MRREFALRGNNLGPEKVQPAVFDELSQHMQRVKTQMLMIHLIETSNTDEIFHPMKFRDKNAVIPDQLRGAREHVPQIVDMREYIVGGDDRGMTVFVNNIRRRGGREERIIKFNAFFVGNYLQIRGGIYIEDATKLLDEVEQDAIVPANIDSKIGRRRNEFLDRRLGIALEMTDHRFACACNIAVFREKHAWVDDGWHLKKRAINAKRQGKRKFFFTSVQLGCL